jgi:hypothetical protein
MQRCCCGSAAEDARYEIAVIAVGAILLLVACVVAIGALLPKHHVVSRSATYRATAEKLYALIAGPQNWRPEVLREESVLDAGNRHLVRETTRNGKTVTYELLAASPPTSLQRRIASENLPYSGAWTFALQPQDGATIVRITEEGDVYNPVFRFVSRFVIGHTGGLDAYLRALGKTTGEDVRIED